MWLTVRTVLRTRFRFVSVLWIVRVPTGPSRLKLTKGLPRTVYARPGRASARGLFGLPDRFQTIIEAATLMPV